MGNTCCQYSRGFYNTKQRTHQKLTNSSRPSKLSSLPNCERKKLTVVHLSRYALHKALVQSAKDSAQVSRTNILSTLRSMESKLASVMKSVAPWHFSRVASASSESSICPSWSRLLNVMEMSNRKQSGAERGPPFALKLTVFILNVNCAETRDAKLTSTSRCLR